MIEREMLTMCDAQRGVTLVRYSDMMVPPMPARIDRVLVRRLDAGIPISTIVGVVHAIMRASLDVDASDLAVQVVRAAAIRHQRSMLIIGTELYRYAFWYTRPDRADRADHAAQSERIGKMVRMPAALSTDWTSVLTDATIGDLVPLHLVALRGFCHIADSIEEYLELVPSSAIISISCVMSTPDPRDPRQDAPIISYVVDAFAARAIKRGIQWLLDLTIHLSDRRRQYAFTAVLLSRLAIRVAESEGLSMPLIELAARLRHLMPPITRFISVGGWWRRLPRRIGRVSDSEWDDPSLVLRGLVSEMSSGFISAVPLHSLIDGLAQLTPFITECPSFSPMNLLAILSDCLSEYADRPRAMSEVRAMIGEMFRYIPAGRTAPLASSEDAVGLLHTKLDARSMSMILELGFIPRDGAVTASIGAFELAYRYTWSPGAIIVLHAHIGPTEWLPSYRKILRYLEAILARSRLSRMTLSAQGDAATFGSMAMRAGHRVWIESIIDGIREAMLPLEPKMRSAAQPHDARQIIDEYERRWPRTWHFRPL